MRLNFIGLDEYKRFAVREICDELNIELSVDADISVFVKKGRNLSVKKEGDNIYISYRKDSELYRGISQIKGVIDGGEIQESAKYQMLCYMVDNSRNAVFNIPTAKQMIRFLAMMGYDSMMLYTEDTFEIPEYKYFGHMRGRFTASELRELDAYAASFGIELIPCVQTLAHLTTALKWPDFDGYKDTEDILMVGDERTYKFVEAVIKQCRACFSSDKINVCMDEAFMLGRGGYLSKNGYRKPSEIILEHLERVVEICKKEGYTPMMWSDMFFRAQFNGSYYIKNGSLSNKTVDGIPDGVKLIYWDYYAEDRETLRNMIDYHLQYKGDTVFADSARTWYGFAPNNSYSMYKAKIHLEECEAKGIDKIIVTVWGDDGNESSRFSILSSLIYFSERCYGGEPESERLDRRSRECFSLGFDDLLAFDTPDVIPGPDGVCHRYSSSSKWLLYNDPLERLLDRHVIRDSAREAYVEKEQRLMALAENERFGYAYEMLGKLCRVLSVKYDLGVRLSDAYGANDRETMRKIAYEELPWLEREIKEFDDIFRRQWYKENKPFGFSLHEIRIGGLIERLRSTRLRLEAYLEGNITVVEELECEALPLKPHSDGRYIDCGIWKKTVLAGLF